MSDTHDVLKAHVKFQLICHTPLHIGASAFLPDLADTDSVDPMPLVLGKNNTPCIPGSTLRGWLRSLLKLQGEIEGTSNASLLFGESVADSEDKRGSNGCVDVMTAFASASHIERRYGHARDAVSNAVEERCLYARQVLPAGSTFDVALWLERPKPKALDYLLKCIAGIDSSIDFALGAAKRSGMGRVTLSENSLVCRSIDASAVGQWLSGKRQSPLWSFDQPYRLPLSEVKRSEASPWRQMPLSLYPQGPFLCEDVTRQEDNLDVRDTLDNNGARDREIRRPLLTGSQRAVVPGTTLKGALRSIAYRQIQTEIHIRDPSLEPSSTRVIASKAIRALFGSESHAGWLSVSDFISDKRFSNDDAQRQAREKTMHASDRFTGGVSGERLFTVEGLYCAELKGVLEYRVVGECATKLKAKTLWLGWILREAWFTPMGVGWGTTRGFGEMYLANEQPAKSDVREDMWACWVKENLPEALASDADDALTTWLNQLMATNTVKPEAREA